MRIMITEDDMTIAGAISRRLKAWGLETHCVSDFQGILEEFQAFRPHLVLLDIRLPFFNGYHWCREIRKISKVPIVFLSSASDNMNIVMAMEMGGDDFIAKPFDMDVLTAKIQAILRRAYDFNAQTPSPEHRGASLNLENQTLCYADRTVELTRNEFRILRLLMERKGQVVTRDALMECLWENDSFVDENTLTVNVNRLRHTLEDAGLNDFIATKKGVGYIVH